MSEQTTSSVEKTFRVSDPEVEMGLLGTQDQFVKLLEEGMNVTIRPFGEELKINGDDLQVDQTLGILRKLAELLKNGIRLNSTDVVSAMKMADRGTLDYFTDLYKEVIIKDRQGRSIRVKNFGQRQYIKAIQENDLTFGIGPAGTGKTFLAVAMAVSALKRGDVEKIILTRPAVEAGESLGFLPGDLKE